MASSNTLSEAQFEAQELDRVRTNNGPECQLQPTLPQCYEEIKTLRWIENSPVHMKALDEWERKTTLLTGRVDRKRKQSLDVKNEIYNLVGFFSVFQGVLLTAVSQANLLRCHNWWSPFILSVLASIVAFVGVWQKFRLIRELEKTINFEALSLTEVVKRVNILRREGEDFRFADFEKPRKIKEIHAYSAYEVLVYSALLSFAVVFAISHPIILCHSGCPDCCKC